MSSSTRLTLSLSRTLSRAARVDASHRTFDPAPTFTPSLRHRHRLPTNCRNLTTSAIHHNAPSSSPSPPPSSTPTSTSDTAKVSSQMKRFWKTVSLHTQPTHYEVKLDKRSLRTPNGTLLAIPKENRLLASLIVHEWNEQSRLIKSHALPMTSLAARSIDGFGDEHTRKEAIEEFLKYAETDTICFHESNPKALVKLQADHWDPLLSWVQQRFGTRPNVAYDTLFISQPDLLISALRNHLTNSMTPLQLAALEKALHLTKSLYLSLALVEGHLTVKEAMDAAWVEQNSQILTWGEVEDSHDVGWAELGRELGAVRLASSARGDDHARL